MYRFTGWRFLSIGKALERAYLLSSLLIDFAEPGAPDGSLDFALEAADSAMSHRMRYAVSTQHETVADLLALDPLNPRSVIHQLNALETHVEYLPNTEPHQQYSPLQRTLLETRAMLANPHTGRGHDRGPFRHQRQDRGNLRRTRPCLFPLSWPRCFMTLA